MWILITNALLQSDDSSVQGLDKYPQLSDHKSLVLSRSNEILWCNFSQAPLFRSPRALFTKAENVAMGTHYQATSAAWHDAQWLLGHRW